MVNERDPDHARHGDRTSHAQRDACHVGLSEEGSSAAGPSQLDLRPNSTVAGLGGGLGFGAVVVGHL